MEKIRICLTKNQNIFFTSDLHFDHRNVIKFCDRPFDTTPLMNQGLIDNWNELVTNDDIVFHLGDLFWFNSRDNDTKLESLNGRKIYLLPGNHDFKSYKSAKVTSCADIVCLTLSAEDWEDRGWDNSTYEIWLCHYPMTTWPHRDKQFNFQLFGHIHSQIGKIVGFDQDLILHTNQYDVGVDRNNWSPVSIDDLLIIFGHMNFKLNE